jgi:DNA repair protein RadA/Sms
MARAAKTVYVCTDCGARAPKWAGQCADCGAWNTLQEAVDAPAASPDGRRGGYTGEAVASRIQCLADVEVRANERLGTGLGELDRVLGGGLVPGSVVLIGGDPGIGKSTLLLQALARLAEAHVAVYVTGEESAEQVSLRAARLSLPAERLRLLTETCVERILALIRAEQPRVLVLDSIQTFYTEALQSAPGSVAQVRETAAQLVRFAKLTDTTCSWSATSPRRARSPAPGCWSTWWTRCSTSRASRTARTGWSAPSRTASAPSTSSASSHDRQGPARGPQPVGHLPVAA